MKKIIYLFFIIVLLKILLSSFILPVLGFADSLNYLNQAKAFYSTHSLTEISKAGIYPPLYSIIISPAFVFNDMNLVQFAIKIINAMISTLIIIPSYLLAKEFFNKKKSTLISLMITIIPSTFSFYGYTMSENLFFPLFMTTIYFLYLALKENKNSYYILAGSLTGLCYLTRATGITLAVTLPIVILLKRKNIKQVSIALGSFILTILPWIGTRILIYGFNLKAIFGQYTVSINEASNIGHISPKIIWLLFYTNYLFLATGIIATVAIISLIKDYKKLNQNQKNIIQIFIPLAIFTLIIAANHSGACSKYEDCRLIGRYVSPLEPLILLIGLQCKKIDKKILISSSVIISLIIPFMLFDKFFPINNSAIAQIGIISFIFEKLNIFPLILATIIIIALIFTLSYLLYKSKKIFKILIIYFIIISLINITIISYDSKFRWEDQEGIALGKWINKNIPTNSKILIDKDEQYRFLNETEKDIIEPKKRSIHILEYWIRSKYTIDPIADYPNYEYIITKKDIPLKIIKEGKEGTKIYHNSEFLDYKSS